MTVCMVPSHTRGTQTGCTHPPRRLSNVHNSCNLPSFHLKGDHDPKVNVRFLLPTHTAHARAHTHTYMHTCAHTYPLARARTRTSILACVRPRPSGNFESPTSTCHSTPTVSLPSATESTTCQLIRMYVCMCVGAYVSHQCQLGSKLGICTRPCQKMVLFLYLWYACACV